MVWLDQGSVRFCQTRVLTQRHRGTEVFRVAFRISAKRPILIFANGRKRKKDREQRENCTRRAQLFGIMCPAWERYVRMILKHRDRELLRFEWIEPQGVRVLSVNEAERKFLPLEMKGVATDESLWLWLTRRTVPRNRRNIEELMARIGLNSRNIRGIISLCRGLSLNDVYWVDDENFHGSWSEVNLYENPSRV